MHEVSVGADTVKGDPAKLHDVLRNLVANAITYSPEHTAIRIEAARPELKKGLGGFLGGLAQQVVEKKVERKLDEATTDAASPRLLEMTTEVVLVSTTVGRNDLAMPTGMRRVE